MSQTLKRILFPFCSLVVALICIYVVITYIDLKPQVDRNFFFSESDPHLQTENRIAELFPGKSQAIILLTYKEPTHEDHRNLVEKLSRSLGALEGVKSVTSLVRGPSSVEDAYESPLWKRLLLAPDGRSSNIILSLERKSVAETISRIETELSRSVPSENVGVAISGVPYIVTKITERLTEEVKKFSLLSFGVFFVLTFLLFRSFAVLVGSLSACLISSCLTFIILDLIGTEPGILTANLWSIVCVMTLSHAVFLTINFRDTSPKDSDQKRRREAIKATVGASTASMITTFLGFLSLLFVDARPLRQFGEGGAVGAVVAFATVYAVLPGFLVFMRAGSGGTALSSRQLKRTRGILKWAWIPILLLSIPCIPKLSELNTDPPLSHYFDEDDPVRSHLEKIDSEGGTSPIELIIRDQQGEPLNTSDAFERMWKLQHSLEEQSQVGSIISLPVLLREANRATFAFLLSWEGIIEELQDPQYQSVANDFITPDRKNARFMIRMNDIVSSTGRDEIIANLERKVRAEGFEPYLVGGFFTLQQRMSVLVRKSMIQGFICLLVLFFIVAWVVSRSFLVAFAMILSLSIVPVLLFGLTVYSGIALDVVSAPAANIAIAMGIDGMLHFVRKRRFFLEREGKADSWDRAFSEIFRPVLFATLIVGIGFAVFVFSSFQSTTNLGILVMEGTLLSAVITLGIFPSLNDCLSRLVGKHRVS